MVLTSTSALAHGQAFEEMSGTHAYLTTVLKSLQHMGVT